MTVIETSQLLIECADWLESKSDQWERLVKKSKYGDYGCLEQTILAEKHREWARAIRQIAIPAPLGSDDEKET